VDDPPGTRPLSDVADGRQREEARVRIPDGLDASLVLVRHGESELIVERRFQGRRETPLSPLGRRQAARVAARLAQPDAPPPLPIPAGPPVAIVHSPLARAADTGGAIASARNETDRLRPDDRFLEIGQGEWEGRLAVDIAEHDAARLAAWRVHPTETWAPGGERLADVRARVAFGLDSLLADLAAAGRPGSILAAQVSGYDDAPRTHPWSILVGHDGVFKVVLLTLFDLPLERFWMWSSELCGISIIEVRAGRPLVRAMNLTDHLAGLGDEKDAHDEAAARARLGAL
jgi:ribonuclease H / adenosylcobalamin/alpha-ribazole phosphatase